jgi:hypothetical protein
MRRYNFNLVEIMLAVVILSVGMASVFVLFPAGLSNHRDAMAENSIADMAELVNSHIRAEAALKSDEDSLDFASTFPAYADLAAEPSENWDEVGNGWTYKKSSTDGYYFVRQLSGPVDDPYVDFAAVVRVYKDGDFNNELFIPFRDIPGADDIKHLPDLDLAGTNNTGSGVKNVKEISTDNIVLPLIVEISYPADVDYAERTKAYFRFEIFNEKYQLIETASGS